MDTDLVVVGTGIAGLMTALVAVESGLRVCVLEKEPLIGGTTARSEAMVWVPCSAQARQAGLEDSPEAALEYLEAATAGSASREKLEAFVAHAPAALEFLENHSDVRYELTTSSIDYESALPGASAGRRALTPLPFDGRRLGRQFALLRPPLDTTMILGGMSISGPNLRHFYAIGRSLTSTSVVAGLFGRYLVDRLRGFPRGTTLTGGNGVLAGLLLALTRRGVVVHTGSPARALLHTGGRVTGAHVDLQGVPTDISARCGVVLACGGFPGDRHRVTALYPHVAAGKSHYTLSVSTNSGDGLSLAESVGGTLDPRVQQPAAWAPASLVPRGSTRVPFPHFGDRCKPGFIAVDRRGRRFVNEATSYHRFVPAMIAACAQDPDVETYLITDHRAQRLYGIGVAPPYPGRLAPLLRSGYLIAAPTVPGLAAKLGIDPDGLAATIERFNASARRGEDPEFGKGADAYGRSNGDPTHQPNPCLAPLETAPFYAVRLVPGDLGTFAGLATDSLGRVLDREGSAIEGLYAVGTDSASLMGGAYPGAGSTVGPAITFAYIAARHAANRIG